MIKVAGLRSKLAIGLSSKVDGDPLAMLLFRVTESLRALVQVYPKLPSNFFITLSICAKFNKGILTLTLKLIYTSNIISL